jgi:hypothetical protein
MGAWDRMGVEQPGTGGKGEMGGGGLEMGDGESEVKEWEPGTMHGDMETWRHGTAGGWNSRGRVGKGRWEVGNGGTGVG